jgi:hypothetical protein
MNTTNGLPPRSLFVAPCFISDEASMPAHIEVPMTARNRTVKRVTDAPLIFVLTSSYAALASMIRKVQPSQLLPKLLIVERAYPKEVTRIDHAHSLITWMLKVPVSK